MKLPTPRKHIAYKEWLAAINNGSVISFQLIRLTPGQWKCVSTILDPKHGEIRYTVGTYRKHATKVMSSAGAWLKLVEAHHPRDNLSLSFSIETQKRK